MSKKTITFEFDPDKIRMNAKEYLDPKTGLESSGGLDPNDLDRAWDEMSPYLDKSLKPLQNAINEIITILCEVHDEIVDQN